VISVLKEMNLAGIEVQMITGVHPVTTKKIGHLLGLSYKSKIINGEQLNAMSQVEF